MVAVSRGRLQIEHVSESNLEAGSGGSLMDPCPEDLSLVLDALITTVADGDDEPLEPWRLTDRRLLAELVEAQLRATRAHARWLSLLAEAEHREASLGKLGYRPRTG